MQLMRRKDRSIRDIIANTSKATPLCQSHTSNENCLNLSIELELLVGQLRRLKTAQRKAHSKNEKKLFFFFFFRLFASQTANQIVQRQRLIKRMFECLNCSGKSSRKTVFDQKLRKGKRKREREREREREGKKKKKFIFDLFCNGQQH